jgi:bifunctional DNase/RNase
MAFSGESFALDDLVPVSVWRLVVSEEGGEESVVILKEDHGETLLPIAIGFCEAAAIRQLVEETLDRGMTLRPLTHELLASAIESLRGRVERGIITRLDHGTFYACLMVRGEAGEFRLDARPSDVICSTLAAGCSLYVLRQLLEEVSGDA